MRQHAKNVDIEAKNFSVPLITAESVASVVSESALIPVSDCIFGELRNICLWYLTNSKLGNTRYASAFCIHSNEENCIIRSRKN